MKNSIFTIAFLLATGIAFAQETPTAAVVKNRTKSNNTNERVSTTTDSTLVDGAKKEYVGHVTINRREAKPNNADTNSNATNVEGIVSEKKHKKTGHVTLLK